MSKPDTILVRIDGEDATITCLPHVLFKLVRPLVDDEHEVKIKNSSGKWQTVRQK